MSCCRRVLARAGAVAGVVLASVASAGSAQADLPAAAVAAARAAAADTVAGARLQVILLTAGQGDAVWEKFGHNLLWIRDTVSGAGVAWNWGKFSFSDPAFLQRFLLGDTRYWMEGDDVAETLAYYESVNREVVAQELALTPGERAALLAFVEANARGENRFYRYDYFLDNCSTRLRDVLDLILGGALRVSLTAQETSHTYRGETLRLVQDDGWLVLGISLALGLPADRPLTEWEAAFVPMRLRDALRTVRVSDGEGGLRPLVARERVMVPGLRPAEPAEFSAGRRPAAVIFAALGVALLGIALGVLRLRGVTAAGVPAAVLAAFVHLVLGVLATVLLAMWLFTKHTFWGWNPHLLLVTPLSLVIAVLVPVRLRRGSAAGTWIETYHLAMAAVAFAVAVAALVRYWYNDDAPGAMVSLWAHASWMVYLGLGFALAPRRIRG